jgi:hypothetical protein
MPRYGTGKDTTCGYKKIDVRFLQKKGYLNPGRCFSLSWTKNGEDAGSVNGRSTDTAVILSYRHRSGGMGEWKQAEYPIWISHTPCHYGSQRPWLHCPARECGRRVAILYGGAFFACRRCHHLAYESQRERDYERALRRAQSIQERLGGSGCVDEWRPKRPKGMHRRTFWRLTRRYCDSVSAMNWGAAARFGIYLRDL